MLSGRDPAWSWLSGRHGTLPTTQQCGGCRQVTDVLLNQSNQPGGGSGPAARLLLSGKLGFSDPSPSPATNSPVIWGKTSAHLSISPASEHVCIDAAEDGTVCKKEHLESYYPPHAKPVNPHSILGGTIHYFYFTEGSKELKALLKDHKGSELHLAGSWIYCKHCYCKTQINCPGRALWYKDAHFSACKGSFSCNFLVALCKPTTLHNWFLNSTTGPHEEYVLIWGVPNISSFITNSLPKHQQLSLNPEELIITPSLWVKKAAWQVGKTRRLEGKDLIESTDSLGPTYWDNSLGTWNLYFLKLPGWLWCSATFGNHWSLP